MKFIKQSVLYLILGASILSCKTRKNSDAVDLSLSPSNSSDSIVIMDELVIEEPLEISADSIKGSRKRVYDILHTDLTINLNWKNELIYGKAKISFKPLAKSINKVVFDAQDFKVKSIHNVKNGKQLGYKVGEKSIEVQLGKFLERGEIFEVEIEYLASPSRSTIVDKENKGLFFKTGNYPKHIWTQGEVEYNSAWFPTFDSPNEKMTQDLHIILDRDQTSLSNGVFKGTSYLDGGKKMDHWQLNKPHSTYLTMLFVGDFTLIKDQSEYGDLSYYLEPEYAHRAKELFGRTPKMLKTFSELLQVNYPWKNLGQVIVRDFTAGGMENTGAIVYYEDMYLPEDDLMGENFDDLVAHEIFHQWFGDLVTCESWANLSLNESFATYGEYLWLEKAKEDFTADYHLSKDKENYLAEALYKREPIINYSYEKPSDLFDHHRYAKGGLIIHMLRNYLGDELFFEGLNKYLQQNAYKNVEMANLRMAFEEVSGEDLQWFFNQWFHKQGHPELVVESSFENGTLTLKVQQTQSVETYPVYRLPVAIDIYSENGVKRHQIVIDKTVREFTFVTHSKPKAVDFDAEKVLLAEIDFSKDAKELEYQYKKAFTFGSKKQALEGIFNKVEANFDPVIGQGLKEDFWYFRQFVLNNFSVLSPEVKEKYYIQVLDIARKDPHPKVRFAALMCLDENYSDRNIISVLENSLNDSQNQIKALALRLLAKRDNPRALKLAREWDKKQNIYIDRAVASIFAQTVNPGYIEYFERKINQYQDGEFQQAYASFLLKQDIGHLAKGIDFYERILSQKQSSETMKESAKRSLSMIQSSLKKREGKDYEDLIKRIDYILQ
jgi:aminopeptidase N